MYKSPLDRPLAALLVSWLLAFSVPGLAATDGWFAANPLPGGNPLQAIDCPPTPSTTLPCVAVGWGGTILTSPDGLSWTRRDGKTVHRLYGIARDGRTLWVAGEGGVVLVSRDGGLSWAFEDSGLREVLFGIAVGTLQGTKKTLVAVGDKGTVLTRELPSGTWTRRRPPILPVFNKVVYVSAQQAFYAAGSSRGIVRSFDGVQWEEVKDSTGQKRLYFPKRPGVDPLLYAPFNAIAFGQGAGIPGTGRIVAVGRFGLIMYADIDPASGGGLRWSTAVPGDSVGGKALIDVHWDGSRFAAIGEQGTYLESADGVNWTAIPRGSGSLVALGLTRIGADYLAAGYFNSGNGIITGGVSRGTRTGPANLSWQKVASPMGSPLNAVAALSSGALAETLVAVGDNGAILHSRDGYAWQAATSVPASAGSLKDVAVVPQAGGDLAYAVGSDATAPTSGIILSSSGGTTPFAAQWVDELATSGPRVPVLNAVHADASAVVAVGNAGAIVRCTLPCTNWSLISPAPTSSDLIAIAGNGSVLVVGSGTGEVFLSSDAGVTWSPAASPPGVALVDIVWTGSEFLAAQADGHVFASPGGSSWARRTPSTANPSINVGGMAWSGHHLVLVGNPVSGAAGGRRIHESDDGGLSFEENGHNDFVRQPLNDVAWNGRQFIAVGENGTILGSDGLDIAVNPRLNQNPGTVLLPTDLSRNASFVYKLTVTNNGNLSARDVSLEIDMPPKGTMDFGGAIWQQANTQTPLQCTITNIGVSSRQKARCALPVDLPVVTLQDSAVQQTTQRAEGINIDVTLKPLQEGPVDLAFRVDVLNLSPRLEDENPVNDRLSVTATVGPEVFNPGPANPFFGEATGGGGGGGLAWFGLAVLVVLTYSRGSRAI